MKQNIIVSPDYLIFRSNGKIKKKTFAMKKWLGVKKYVNFFLFFAFFSNWKSFRGATETLKKNCVSFMSKFVTRETSSDARDKNHKVRVVNSE